MRKKLFAAILSAAFISGCASTTPHQYDKEHSYAWNLSQAAEMGSVMEDNIPSEDMVKGWGVLGNAGYAAIQSGFSFGSSFGLHMLGAMAIDSNKNYYANRDLIVLPMDTIGKSKKEVGLELSNMLADTIKRLSPSTTISKLDHQGFYTHGDACKKLIEVYKSVGDSYEAMEKIGCGVFIETEVLGKNSFIETDIIDSNIVKAVIHGDYQISNFAKHMPELYFYYSPRKTSEKLLNPALFAKDGEVFLFIKPTNGIEFKTDTSSAISYYEKDQLFN